MLDRIRRRPCLVALGRFDEPRGSLCAAEVGQHLEFAIQRAYWLFDLPAEAVRGQHAHRDQDELLVAVSGSFRVHCDDGERRSVHTLSSPETGLLVPPMVFHHLDRFSPGAVCLAFASGPYDGSAYVGDYEEFCRLVGAR